MIEGLSNSEKFIYHYTKASTAIDFILKKRSIRFGPYIQTNDPKETKTWRFDIGSNEQRDLTKYDMEKESKWLSGYLKNRTRLVCFCRDMPGLSGNHIQDIYKRGYCKPRMWAQYAAGHTGVCLVFDKEHLIHEIKRQIGSKGRMVLGLVEYVNYEVFEDLFEKRPYLINVDALEDLGRDEYARLHLEKHVHRLFLQKMTDWQNECEWRCVVFANTDDEIEVKFGTSLAGLMFGADTSPEDIAKMMTLTESLSPRYMRLKWNNCSPWYDYSPKYIPNIKQSPWGEFIE